MWRRGETMWAMNKKSESWKSEFNNRLFPFGIHQTNFDGQNSSFSSCAQAIDVFERCWLVYESLVSFLDKLFPQSTLIQPQFPRHVKIVILNTKKKQKLLNGAATLSLSSNTRWTQKIKRREVTSEHRNSNSCLMAKKGRKTNGRVSERESSKNRTKLVAYVPQISELLWNSSTWNRQKQQQQKINIYMWIIKKGKQQQLTKYLWNTQWNGF